MNTAVKSLPEFVEVLIWVLLLFSVACVAHVYRPQPLSNDSFQYLSVAQNETQGRGIATSLICFDSERSHGVIPAPLTTFAPGYPTVVAAVGHFFEDLQAASRFISVVAFSGTGALLAWALILTGVELTWRMLALTVYMANAVSLSFATSILTEPLYMFVTIAAVVLLIWAERSTLRVGTALFVSSLAYILAGLSYFVRYAGLFIIAALIIHAFLLLLMERTARRAIQFGLSFLSVAIAAILMLRNVASVGTWKGGNTMAVYNSLRSVLVAYVKGHFHLFFGEHKVVHGVWEGLFLIAALVACICLVPLAVRALRVDRISHRGIDPAILLVVLSIGVYTAGLVYAGLRTDISFGTRMFEPIFPLYVLLAAIAVNWLLYRAPDGTVRFVFQTAFGVAIVALIGINGRDFKAKQQSAPDQALIPLFAEPMEDGQTLRQWVASNIPHDATIFAEEGQATGYLLDHPTVDLLDAEYSPVRWECGEVNYQMRRFHSTYLVLYRSKDLREAARLSMESSFVRDAINLQPLCGFTMVAANRDVLILKSTDSDRGL